MIRPGHTCWWSGERTTHLEYAGGRLRCSGTSLPVLLEPFRDQPLRWYSRLFGPDRASEAENLRLVAVDGSTPPIAGPGAYDGDGPLNAGLDGRWRADEWRLTDAVCEALGLGGQDEDFAPRDLSGFRYTLVIHDDCFAAVQPVDGPLLRDLLHATLELHAYYLNREVDWGETAVELARVLERAGEFELVSDPKSLRVGAYRVEEARRYVFSRAAARPLAAIQVDAAGMARLT